MKNELRTSVGTLALLVVGMGAPLSAAAQSDILLQLRSGSPQGDRFRVDSSGGLVAMGTIGMGIIPATGTGYRLMWYPYKTAFRAGYSGTAGQWDDVNIGFFSWAGGAETRAKGVYSFAFGNQSIADGAASVSLGNQSQATGVSSVAIGSKAFAGLSYRNAPNSASATAIGYQVTADADYSTAMGYRATTAGHRGAFVWGGWENSFTDSVEATADGQFVARAPGGFRFRTSSNLTTGCDLAAGGGMFACTSSRTEKDSFEPVSGEDVLSHVRAMPIMKWKFIAERSGIRHLGPFAEDFYAAFGLGDSNKAIALNDLGGVAIAAAKALEERTAELREENAVLRREASELRAREAELERRQAELESRQARMEKLLESVFRLQ